ncbi:hypothetical protein [Aliikangiella sp. IMCC44359]|uniref:hypothetical protein n=1 Tax=Aliikangiella sp. IMCC44359 TaxID=3459125 RepID=UPI00403B0887
MLQRGIEQKPDIMRAAGFVRLAERYPKLSAWKDRVSALPNINKTLPHHWNQ